MGRRPSISKRTDTLSPYTTRCRSPGDVGVEAVAMCVRSVASRALLWMLGVLWFVVSLPGEAGPIKTDAVVVATGGAGRIKHGLAVLASGQARALFVSGVDPDVTSEQFGAQFEVPRRQMQCCVTLGYEAKDTHGNAAEIARWIAEGDVRSVRRSEEHTSELQYVMRVSYDVF